MSSSRRSLLFSIAPHLLVRRECKQWSATSTCQEFCLRRSGACGWVSCRPLPITPISQGHLHLRGATDIRHRTIIRAHVCPLLQMCCQSDQDRRFLPVLIEAAVDAGQVLAEDCSGAIQRGRRSTRPARSRSWHASAIVTSRWVTSFTASSMNSRLNARLVISTLQFHGRELIYVPTKPAAGYPSCTNNEAGPPSGGRPVL